MIEETVQKYAYEIVNGSAVIWRCFARSEKAEIPRQIDGYPVTKIASYAFSAHMKETDLVGKMFTSTEEMPALCGNLLKEIVLPDTVVSVGRYCFYNCEQLKRISFTDTLKDWGSGAFTGCHQVDELELFIYKDGASTLKDVLTEMVELAYVDYYRQKDGKMEYTRLVFPEFYEEGVENTPARLINLTIHGSGMRFRNCFRQRVLILSEFDACFNYAGFQEKFPVVAELTEGRLRYPLDLSETAKKRYERFIEENLEEFSSYIIGKKEMGTLGWYVELLSGMECVSKEIAAETLTAMTEKASSIGFHEGLSFLMDYQHAHGRKKQKMTFDL